MYPRHGNYAAVASFSGPLYHALEQHLLEPLASKGGDRSDVLDIDVSLGQWDVYTVQTGDNLGRQPGVSRQSIVF